MRQGAFEQYINYFEEIANRHPLIQYFLPIDEDDLVSGNLRVNGKYPAMIVEYPDLPLADNSTNTDTMLITGITILESVQRGEPGQAKQALINTEKILLDVVSQMREDRKRGKFHINTNDIKLDKVGPIFSDYCYGWRMEFKYRQWVDLSYKAEQWNEYDPNKFAE
jgi:hypothetical protein